MSGDEIPCCPELFELFDGWYWLSSVFTGFQWVVDSCFRDKMQVCIHECEYVIDIDVVVCLW